ncbi:MAG: acetate--CoA ligase family protein [Syntrophobacteraceae bacterium]|nr:acetate--CoA ligase family protein [Syntrophobacteraceae bacterium]
MKSCRKSLDRLFNPGSIAVVGATREESKAGFTMLHALKDFRGEVYPINPKGGEIDHRKAYPNLKSIGRPVDLVALCIPAAMCLSALKEAAEAGARAAVIASGGFGESGKEGLALQEEILSVCRDHSMRLLGPNTAGFVNPGAGVAVHFNPLVTRFRPGPIGLITQSGAMNVVVGSILESEGLGISIGAGTGNALDITVSEMIGYLSLREDTRCIALYLEGVEDGRELYDAVYEASLRKPIVAFAVGKADIGEFAVSHTGKTIGSFALKKAALIQAGAVVVSSSRDLVDAANVLSKVRLAPKQNPGVGVLSGQAGPAMVISDYLRSRSVNMPQLGEDTMERIAGLLSVKTYIKNPVDTARPSPDLFLEVLSLMAAEERIDILLAFALHVAIEVEPVALFRSVRERTQKALIFGTAGLDEEIVPTAKELCAIDVAVFRSPDQAAVAAWALTQDSRAYYRKKRQNLRARSAIASDTLRVSPDEAEAKLLLRKMGIDTPIFVVCESHAEAVWSFRKMKKPCVAKILSAAIAHKTEVGGVHFPIQTEEQLLDALRKIDAIEVPGKTKYLVEEMAPAGLEIIVGATNDVSFGPTVMAGLGGTAAEALGDNSMRLAPLDLEGALEMMSELRAARLFDRWRGGPSYDKMAVAALLVTIGQFMEQHPEIKEVDLNPVRVFEKGVVVLDALMVCGPQE